MSYFVGMSPVEMQFIRVYVAALRRHYDELRTVVDIMNPDNLDVKDFYDATKVATALHELHEDFEARLIGVQRKHNLRHRVTKPTPTDDDIADLFGLSFFKLVATAEDDSPTVAAINKNGWFSGKPDEWKNALKSYKNAPKNEEPNLPDLLSQCFSAFAKIFQMYNTFPDNQPPAFGKKIWPLKNDKLDEYDEPDNPFDWLYEDDDE